MVGKDENLSKMEISCIVINLFILGAFTLILGLFLNTKPILDKASKITLIVFACCFVLRGVNWAVAIYYGYSIDYLQIGVSFLSDIIVWVILYFFIFTMHEVKIKLEMNSVMEQNKKMIRLRRIKFFIIISVICLNLIDQGISSFQIFKKNLIIDFDSPLSILNLISQLIRIAIAVSIFIQAIWLLTFFVKKKDQKMGYTYQSYTKFNKLIIFSTFFLICLNFLHEFSKSIFSILFYTELCQNYIMNAFIVIERYAVVPMIDFMTCLAFIYLFKYESNRMKQQRKHLESRVDLSRPNYQTQSLINILKKSPTSQSVPSQFQVSSGMVSLNDSIGGEYENDNSAQTLSKNHHGDHSSNIAGSYNDDSSTFKSFLIDQLYIFKNNQSSGGGSEQ